LFPALRSKGKKEMSNDTQSAPNIAFFRNIGMTLLTPTVAAGAFGVAGCLVTSEPLVLVQSPNRWTAVPQQPARTLDELATINLFAGAMSSSNL